MSRAYDDNQTLQQKIMKGANILADNVASTLGPRGRNVLLQEKGKTPFITKDGVTVAHFVACVDPFENASVQIIKRNKCRRGRWHHHRNCAGSRYLRRVSEIYCCRHFCRRITKRVTPSDERGD